MIKTASLPGKAPCRCPTAVVPGGTPLMSNALLTPPLTVDGGPLARSGPLALDGCCPPGGTRQPFFSMPLREADPLPPDPRLRLPSVGAPPPPQCRRTAASARASRCATTPPPPPGVWLVVLPPPFHGPTPRTGRAAGCGGCTCEQCGDVCEAQCLFGIMYADGAGAQPPAQPPLPNMMPWF